MVSWLFYLEFFTTILTTYRKKLITIEIINMH